MWFGFIGVGVAKWVRLVFLDLRAVSRGEVLEIEGFIDGRVQLFMKAEYGEG